eukprot:15435793-Alexandrium_andersonii.AAC.1
MTVQFGGCLCASQRGSSHVRPFASSHHAIALMSFSIAVGSDLGQKYGARAWRGSSGEVWVSDVSW